MGGDLTKILVHSLEQCLPKSLEEEVKIIGMVLREENR
jgi:hypothetical protein